MRFSRVDALLLCAVIAAIALALSGVLERGPDLPGDAVAAVNGRTIGAGAITSQLEAVAAQLKRAPDASERAAILERVIDEELLLQQGLALELPRKDARLRAQLVQEVIRQAMAESARSPVTEAELRAFHAAQTAFFRQSATYRVWRFDCRDAAAARALQAQLGAGGEPAPQDGCRRNALLPDAWLGAAKLRDYLGAELALAVAALAPGASLLSERADTTRVLLLLAVVPPREPEFAQVRAQVETEFRRRRDEAALAAYLARLRAAAELRIDGE
jgi:hypothetical protein